MIKHYLLCILCAAVLTSQGQGLKITYSRSNNDIVIPNQDPLLLYTDLQETVITSLQATQSLAKYPYETYFVDRQSRSFYKYTRFSASKDLAMQDQAILSRDKFTLMDSSRVILGYTCKLAKTSINSNSIDIWYTTEAGFLGAPNESGQELGLVLEYIRNGNSKITATAVEKISHIPAHILRPEFQQLVDGQTYTDLLWKSRFIQIPIFQNEQVNFVDNPKQDSVMRFAQGTVILKKVKVPILNKNSQAFLELVQKSNGDAYDRTGSVFMIAADQDLTFLDGMNKGMATLPMYQAGDGKAYPGMVRTPGYSPVHELMRFFTSFGVSHFNNRVTLKGKTWQDSSIYRQDISEFLTLMSGQEVYIGTYIGNYDKGGHKLSLELTIHPGSSKMDFGHVMPLFNTTNVMEMGGQTYATFFSDPKGLEMEFELAQDAQDVYLRYITTGHGGWGEGDEFVPKENSIFLDNELLFKFTPWRTDCGAYRLYNPVSGNFQNGLSSSDLSRSNWCPGTVTNPNYIFIGDLKAGKHKLQVRIPQGAPEGTSFSFWNVSGALLYN